MSQYAHLTPERIVLAEIRGFVDGMPNIQEACKALRTDKHQLSEILDGKREIPSHVAEYFGYSTRLDYIA